MSEGITYEEYRELVRNADVSRCPVRRLLDVFSGKWHIRVIFELTKVDSIRFLELSRRIDGITTTMLSGTLKDLESQGIVSRVQYNEIPPHVEYSLTDAGKDLYRVFFEMALWSQKHLAEE